MAKILKEDEVAKQKSGLEGYGSNLSASKDHSLRNICYNQPFFLQFVNTISIDVWDVLFDCTLGLRVKDVIWAKQLKDPPSKITEVMV